MSKEEQLSLYQQAVASLRDQEKLLGEETTRHQKEVARRRTEISRIKSLVDYAERGGSIEDAIVARRVLQITWARTPAAGQPRFGAPNSGPLKQTPEVFQQINNAIERLRDKWTVFGTSYLGVKDYAEWDSQIHNSDYGYGPTHGNIWFSIGFQPSYRDTGLLSVTEEERLACIRYLAAIRDNPGLLG